MCGVLDRGGRGGSLWYRKGYVSRRRPATSRKGPELLIKNTAGIAPSEITDESVYLRRRDFIRLAGGAAVAAAAAPLLACSGEPVAAERGGGGTFGSAQSPLTGYKEKAVATDEKLNTFDEITGYNNFYEFGTEQERSQAQRRIAHDQPVDSEDRRALQQAG